MNDEEVIAQIIWKVADIRSAFVDRYGRQPTDGELKDAVENVKSSPLVESSIGHGWGVISDEI